MPTPFAPPTLAELAARLEERRTTSSLLVSKLHADASKALEDRDVSDLLDSDDPDSGTNDTDRAWALQLAELASRTAAAADDALDRLAAGTYGTCRRCGERIPLARLRAVPETDRCVDCKVAEGRLLVLAR